MRSALGTLGMWLVVVVAIGSIAVSSTAVPVGGFAAGGGTAVSLGAGAGGASPAPAAPSDPATLERSSAPLELAASDAAFMNRIYHQLGHEVGYCGLIEADRLEPWLADTVSSSEEALEFDTANCPGAGAPPATIHTHPSGSTALSATDRAAFEGMESRYMCIQGGAIEAEPGERASGIACYERITVDGSPAIASVPVVIGS